MTDISPAIPHEDHAARICWCGAGPKSNDWQNDAMTFTAASPLMPGEVAPGVPAQTYVICDGPCEAERLRHRILVLENIICTLRQSDQEGLWHGQLSDEEEAVMKEVYGA